MILGKSVANLPVWDARTIVVNLPASVTSAGLPSHSEMRAALLVEQAGCLDENVAGIMIGSAVGVDILIGSTKLSATAQDEGILITGGTTGYFPMQNTVPDNMTYQSASPIDVMVFYS